MQCYNCGVEVPEGRTTCPSCGAEFASEDVKSNESEEKMIGWNPDGTPIYGKPEKLVGKYRAACKPFRLLYICELILVCISTLALPLNAYLFFTTMSYLDGNSEKYDKITAITRFTDKYSWLLVVIMIVLFILLAISFSIMKYYEPGFQIVLYAGAIMIAVGFLAGVFDKKNGIAEMLSLCTTIASCVYYFNYFYALENFTRPSFPKMANTWGWLKGGYIAVYFSAGILKLIQVKENLDNSYSPSWARIIGTDKLVSKYQNVLVLSHMENLIRYLLLVIEVWMIRKTYKLCVSTTRRRRSKKKTATR